MDWSRDLIITTFSAVKAAVSWESYSCLLVSGLKYNHVGDLKYCMAIRVGFAFGFVADSEESGV